MFLLHSINLISLFCNLVRFCCCRKEHLLSDGNQDDNAGTGDEQDDAESAEDAKSYSIEISNENLAARDPKASDTLTEVTNRQSDNSGSDLDALFSSGLAISRSKKKVNKSRSSLIFK